MKKLTTLLCALFLMTISSFATDYHVASFAGVMYSVNVNNGTIKMTPVSSRTLITAVAAANSLPASDFVVAVREVSSNTAGPVVVLQVKDQNRGAEKVTVIGATGGTTADVLNSAGNDHYVALSVIIAVPAGNFQGSAIIHTKGGTTGLHSAAYTFNGGAGGAVIKGTVALTGKKYTF